MCLDSSFLREFICCDQFLKWFFTLINIPLRVVVRRLVVI